MKKALLLSICVMTLVIFSACKSADTADVRTSSSTPPSSISVTEKSPSEYTKEDITESVSISEEISTAERNDESSTLTQNDAPEEVFVMRYEIYAEEGAEIVWYDENTGEFEFKWLCEECGTKQSGTSMGHYLTIDNSGERGGFVCTNPKCPLFGEGQEYFIKCHATGEWVVETKEE